SFFIVTRTTDAGFTLNLGTSIVASTTIAGTGTTYASMQSGLTPSTSYFYKIQSANEGLPPSTGITGSQATSGAATYFWVGASGADWNTPASWNTLANNTGTTRATPLTTDILVVDGMGTTAGLAGTISVSASASIGALQITNSTAVTIQSSTTTTRTLTLTGSAGDELSIPSGSSIILNNATQAAAI